jgi:hypothetical protein
MSGISAVIHTFDGTAAFVFYDDKRVFNRH